MITTFARRAVVVAALLVLGPAAGADEPKKEKPTEFTLVNKVKDIRVVSDRDEAILDFFRRNRVLVGAVVPEELKKITEAKDVLPKFFVNYASQNDDPQKASTFGATIDVAPPPETVARLLGDAKKKTRLTLILRRDEKKDGLYHVVGCTERTPVGFFDDDKKNATDGFSQKDLCFKGDAKK